MVRTALATVLASALSGGAQGQIPLSTYTNATTGVRFQYPSVWKPVAKPEAQTQPFLFDQGLQPVIDLEFSPKGNLYEKTNLVGLDFVYAAPAASSVAACYKLGEVDSGVAQKEMVTINGVPYQHAFGGEAAMCHEMSANIYATYRDGVCHLFEQDFMTVCAGVQEGTRGLTPAETKALQHHLDAIMQSVTFSAQP